MSVRIRLTRAGRKKVPHYRIVVMDSRNRRDGAYLDHLGVYHPNQQPAQFEVNEEKALHWLSQGAVPSETVRSLLSQRGLMLRFDLLKRQTPPDKIAAEMAKWHEAMAAKSAAREEVKKRKGKAKAAAPTP